MKEGKKVKALVIIKSKQGSRILLLLWPAVGPGNAAVYYSLHISFDRHVEAEALKDHRDALSSTTGDDSCKFR